MAQASIVCVYISTARVERDEISHFALHPLPLFSMCVGLRITNIRGKKDANRAFAPLSSGLGSRGVNIRCISIYIYTCVYICRHVGEKFDAVSILCIYDFKKTLEK